MVISYLKSIADNNTVPGYSQMRREHGRPFRHGIKALGGYKHVVTQAGLKIRKHHTASDGHILSSYYEYLFDEFLFLNNIPHDVDDFICSDSQCRYDFKISDVYVEIWGIGGNGKSSYNNYCKRRKYKESLYQKLGLTLVSFEGKDFGLDSNELQKLFKERLADVGIHSNDQHVDYPIFNRRKLGYWNEQSVIKELQSIIRDLGDFPTYNQLRDMNRNDLAGAVRNLGGLRKFARMLGYQPKTQKYSESRVIRELKELTKQLGHFPCDRELQEMNRSGLAGLIKAHGGYGQFKEKVTGKRTKRPYGYWRKEENVIKELRELTHKLGRFPKYAELGHVAKGVDKSGKGMEYFEGKIS